jgi:hypothetical protein
MLSSHLFSLFLKLISENGWVQYPPFSLTMQDYTLPYKAHLLYAPIEPPKEVQESSPGKQKEKGKVINGVPKNHSITRNILGQM